MKLTPWFHLIAKSKKISKKNKVTCSIATANNNATLGFSSGLKCSPQSLMKGNALSSSAILAGLILQKNKNEECYNNIIVGDAKVLNEYLKINLVPISKELQDLVNNETNKKTNQLICFFIGFFITIQFERTTMKKQRIKTGTMLTANTIQLCIII